MPQRPPKKWFYQCVKSVSQDPMVTDPKAVCAWNWHYHMSATRQREILAGEVFDPDTDLETETFVFDPKKRKRKRYGIRLAFGDLIPVWHRLKRLIWYVHNPRGVKRLKKETKVTLVFSTKTAWERAKRILGM